MSLTLIATTTVGAGGASSIDFTSIPQTYTDLYVVYSLRSNRSSGGFSDGALMRFNGSTSAIYTTRTLVGNGSSASSLTDASSTLGIYNYIGAVSNTATSNTFGNGSAYIPNYAGSTNKSVSVDAVGENNNTTAYQGIISGIWASTAAITQVNLRPEIGTLYLEGSTASLYGITKGSGGATVSP